MKVRKKTSVVAIIPARGGSKGIPRKNVAILGGKPLIAHTIEAAKGARLVDRILVTTDSVEIAEAARECGAEVPVLRPAELAGDQSNILLACVHLLHHLRVTEGLRPTATLLLQPTSPFRAPEDIDAAARMILDGCSSVASVVELMDRKPHYFIGQQTPKFRQEKLSFPTRMDRKYVATGYVGGNRFYPNFDPMDMSITQAIRRASLHQLRLGNLHLTTKRYGFLIVDWIKGMDIDDPDDLDFARHLLATGQVARSLRSCARTLSFSSH